MSGLLMFLLQLMHSLRPFQRSLFLPATPHTLALLVLTAHAPQMTPIPPPSPSSCSPLEKCHQAPDHPLCPGLLLQPGLSLCSVAILKHTLTTSAFPPSLACQFLLLFTSDHLTSHMALCPAPHSQTPASPSLLHQTPLAMSQWGRKGQLFLACRCQALPLFLGCSSNASHSPLPHKGAIRYDFL